MSVTVTGKVSASIPVSGVVTLIFTDTTTGVGTLISRTLVIKDANGNILSTIDMVATLIATYDVYTDGYYTFTETIVDNTGTYAGTENFLCEAFYMSLFAIAVASLPNECDTFGVIYNLVQAQLDRSAAEDMGLFGQGLVAQALITQANFLVTTPYYA